MTTETHNTDTNNGFEGVPVNETLNSEIEKRIAIVEKMNEYGNWTMEMEEKEDLLNEEIDELIQARIAFENN